MVAVVGWWDVEACRSARSIASRRGRSVMGSMKEKNGSVKWLRKRKVDVCNVVNNLSREHENSEWLAAMFLSPVLAVESR